MNQKEEKPSEEGKADTLITLEGTSMKDALQILLQDDSLSDITLRGNDGVLVKANRCILAARSTVFRRMLFGEFAEASSPHVDFGYEGHILKAVLEYIYTEKVTCALDASMASKDLADNMAALYAAANYYNLGGLLQIVVEKLIGNTAAQEVSLFLLEACVQYCEANHALAMEALDSIRFFPMKGWNKNVLQCLSAGTMSAIIDDMHSNATELDLFKLLQWWVKETQDPSDEPENEKTFHTRALMAREMVKRIRLDLINPHILSTTVVASNLVTRDQLFEAYRIQALRALGNGKSARMLYDEPRSMRCPAWNSARPSDTLKADLDAGETTRAMYCSARVGRAYLWKLKMLKLLDVGDSCRPQPKIEIRLTAEPNKQWTWNNGGCCSCWKMDFSKSVGYLREVLSFGEDDELRLELNLKGDSAENGTLAVSINDGVPALMFTGIIPELFKEDGQVSVLKPQASVSPGCSIRVLSFEEVEEFKR